MVAGFRFSAFGKAMADKVGLRFGARLLCLRRIGNASVARWGEVLVGVGTVPGVLLPRPDHPWQSSVVAVRHLHPAEPKTDNR